MACLPPPGNSSSWLQSLAFVFVRRSNNDLQDHQVDGVKASPLQDAIIVMESTQPPLGDAKLQVLTDEPMCACIDVFDDDVRVHFVSPTNPELGGVVLIATRDASGVISLRGGDEYWWDGYPPIIHAREKGTAAKPPKPVFSGSFFEKDVAVRGLQGGA